ncbi:MAG: type II toxin-antitoxin system VapC family toxin [Promethearchaeota archaeon]
MSKEVKIKIDLDSNVFRNQSFINWLILNKEQISVQLSVIVYLETLFFYLTRTLSPDDFDKDLADFSAEIGVLGLNLSKKVAQHAIKSSLPFKHHARDFIIGTTTLERNAVLLSYNVKHFQWMPKNNIKTPEQFMEDYIVSD